MKNTKQKSLVLDIVSRKDCHYTIEQLYEEVKNEIPNISLATVYRIISKLLEEGIIRKIKVEDGFDKYDILDSHDHFICNNCGAILDIFNKNKGLSENFGGNRVMSYEVYYKGICNKCLEKESNYGTKRIKN